MATQTKQRNREISGLLYLLAAGLIVVALATYQPLDPSWNVAAPSQEVANRVGRVGAVAADLLFQLLGLMAVLLPLPLLLVGFKKLRGVPIEDLWFKLMGFLGLLLSSSGLFSLLEPYLGRAAEFSFQPGGAMGLVVSRFLVGQLNWVGSLIVLATLVLVFLVLTTRFSIESTLNRLQRARERFSPDLSGRWRAWRKRREDRRRLREIRESGGELVTQPPPRRLSFESQPPADPRSGDEPTVVEPAFRRPEPPTDRTGAAVDRPQPAGETSPVFALPELEFLQDPPEEVEYDESELMDRAQKLQTKCAEFDVHGRVQQIHPGPVVTTFEFKPDPGVKYSRITSLADDLCLALKAESVRIDRVPGKNTVGIEVPNVKRHVIYLKEILASEEFQRANSVLTLALGQRINGATFVADLGRMPHLLIAGSTGSGKSVGLNCMVCSVLYKARPDEVRFILVDPKRLELGLYENIPHLLTPIVTDPKQAANALNWAVREMEERYRILARRGVRNIAQYNTMVRSGEPLPGEEPAQPLPYILIIVDELADLMMTSGKAVETAVTRLAQMARAVGIHLILATQRPSVDVITGLIKANFPCRISFRVSSKIDSRTILDANGAESLLGMGDMLYLSPETSRLVRVHGAYISEKEIGRIVQFLCEQGEPEYREEILLDAAEEGDEGAPDFGEVDDQLYEEAARFVVETRKASTSLLQRRFRIGYGRAARLLDIMEHEGLIGPPDGSRPREVLVPVNYFDEPEA
jgi:S-DNA-T family DNA segregation ATPase FtsK/SpoIIIE